MTLSIRGVVYDVGVEPFPGRSSRPNFETAACERDMDAIAGDLGCTAVRIVGRDLGRVRTASEIARDRGLDLWLSPMVHDATPSELLAYLSEAALVAEQLRTGGTVVLAVGWELTMFMRGLVSGRHLTDRMRTFGSPGRLLLSAARHGPFDRGLNRFLANARAAAREHFDGPLTYASGMWETVDWTDFDYVGVDAYRDLASRDTFADRLAPGDRTRPLVATELGCSTYVGARDRGGLGWAIVDRAARPPRIVGDHRRSEREQAEEIGAVLDILEPFAAGAFVFTFASWNYPHHDDPELDLDMAANGIVAVSADGTWRPKEAFAAVAARYRR